MDTSYIHLTRDRVAADILERAGVGLKAEHTRAILEDRPNLGWVEVHPETYMVAGGPRHATLEAVRERYPLSLHGVALSLGGAEPLDRKHLRALRALVDRYEPGLVSEHVAWSAHDGVYFGDLLPVPLTASGLDRLCANVAEAQEALGRQILIGNPSNYLLLPDSEIPEPEFLVDTVRRTGCGLLVDVNNICVSAANVGYDAEAYIDTLPVELIGQATRLRQVEQPIVGHRRPKEIAQPRGQLKLRDPMRRARVGRVGVMLDAVKKMRRNQHRLDRQLDPLLAGETFLLGKFDKP